MKSHEFSRTFLAIWTAATCFFVIVPLIFVALVSLTSRSYLSLPTDGISFRWYANIANNPQFLSSTYNSLWLAVVAALASLIMGTMMALATTRYHFSLRETVRLSATSPLFIPTIMSGLAILLASSSFGWSDPTTRLVVGHIALTLPYVFRTVSASLTGFDLNQELAAQNLGASAFKAFILVTLPQMLPGVMAGLIFAFIVSFDNVSMSVFLSGVTYKTLPVELFVYASQDNDPTVAAVSVVMILVSLIVIALVEKFFGIQRVMSGKG
jgi:putative spermidine/putrescine transport system permease protein